MKYTIAQILFLTAVLALILGFSVKPAIKISQSAMGDGFCDTLVMMGTFFFSDETVIAEDIKNGRDMVYGLGVAGAFILVVLIIVFACVFGIPWLIRLYKRTKPKKEEESTTSGFAGSGADQDVFISFLKDISDNYDCDIDGHTHGSACRSCEANAILRSMGIKTFHQEMIDDGTIEDFHADE
ncbi:MAG: hypothetical protein ACXADB_06110 [Candidatus Hermodarchaeia archaeon]|jgi:hypothetical protein